jgi:hypothetical protein
MDEYPFRFPVQKESELAPVPDLNELLRKHLCELLDLLVPTKGDREIRVEGYKLLNDRDSIHPLYPSDDRPDSAKATPSDLYEPRLGYIQRIMQSLLAIVDLEVDGEVVHVDGFRLKNLSQWLSAGGAADILAHAASRCNSNCRFCYNKGAPSLLKPKQRKPSEEHQEIQTRIKYYEPRAKLNVFPNMGSPCEALAHPHILAILRSLRRKTGEALRIPTNGSTLTPDMIQALADIKPVYLDISLNSASLKRRRWLMQDPEPQLALDALTHLKDARIPYSVIIVPWPLPSPGVMLEDLRETVHFASSHEPTLIQVSLPGYSRFFPEKEIFPDEEIWNRVKTEVQALRVSAACPIVLRPGLFEDYLDPKKVDAPYLSGVIKNSPAARAGLCRGDRLLKVNGLPVKNRHQTRSLMTILHQSDLMVASLSIQRNGTAKDLDVSLRDFDYPYFPETSTHLGAVFPSSGIPRQLFDRLQQIIRFHQAKDVLVMTSRLVCPALEKFLCEHDIVSGVRLHVRVPNNSYFGGNIFMGDLMVVQDFIEAVKEFIDKGKAKPDLVIIPSSPFHLSGWGRDLTGRVYLDIERHTGVTVALLECDPIFD